MTISENITNNHLDLTDSAIGHFSSLLKNKDNQNIRIGIRDSGCSDLVVAILEHLVATCKSGDLHLICLALDCFYEIFSEDYFVV